MPMAEVRFRPSTGIAHLTATVRYEIWGQRTAGTVTT